MAEQTTKPLNCLDCGTPHLGTLVWAGEEIAWVCAPCCAKYPSAAAVGARVEADVRRRYVCQECRTKRAAPGHQP